jgi:hypothetical protein
MMFIRMRWCSAVLLLLQGWGWRRGRSSSAVDALSFSCLKFGSAVLSERISVSNAL